VSSDTLGVDPTNFASAPSESVDPLGHRTERREKKIEEGRQTDAQAERETDTKGHHMSSYR